MTVQNGVFTKADQIPAITEARNSESKAERNFVIEYDPFKKAVYFLKNGALCRVSLASLSKVEEVIMPVGGIRIIAFSVLSSGRKAMLKFIPSNIVYNRSSGGYFSAVFRLFDLSNGRPLTGLNYSNQMNAIISPDGNRILSSSMKAAIPSGWLYDVDKGEELRTYGPAIMQRMNSYSWTLIIDDHYLYMIPAANDKNKAINPYIKVYDLLDSLRPVNSFTFATNPYFTILPPTPPMQASGIPKKFPQGTKLKQVIDDLQPLTLPVSFNTFFRPVPGKEVPPSCWRSLGFDLINGSTGSSSEATVADSSAGRFQVYVIGQLSSSASGKSFVVASHHFNTRSPNIPDNESNSTLRYWLCTYDNKTGTATRQRLLAEDDILYINDAWYFPPNTTEIRKLGINELYFYTRLGDNFYINTETLAIRK